MPKTGDRLKVLLAVPSPLFAPLYLAKATNLDPVFQEIQFEYRNSRRKADRGDPLVRDVVSQTSHLDCIAAVGDPYRALLKEADMMDRPLILGGLVRHMCYWLIDDDVAINHDNEAELPTFFDQLIVNQRHTAGYAIAADHLLNQCNMPSIENVDKKLYSTTVAGYEYNYYRYFRRKHKLAYMTTNPLSLYARQPEQEIMKAYLTDQRYRDTFMTGVIVGTEAYQNKRAEIDGLMHGIIRGIERINSDPLLAATQLQSYQDSLISFGAEETSFKHLVQALEYLAGQGVFPEDAKVSSNQMQRGADVRRSARPINPDTPHLVELEKITEFVNKSAIDSIAQESSDHEKPINKHAPWLESFVVETLNVSGSAGDRLGGFPLSLAFAAVLSVVSVGLLFTDLGQHLGTMGKTLSSAHVDLSFLAKQIAAGAAVVSMLCTGLEWWRYVTKVRLIASRTFVLNVVGITSCSVLFDVFFGRDAAIGNVMALTLAAAAYWLPYHSVDIRRSLTRAKRLMRNLQIAYLIVTAPAPAANSA